MRSLLCSFYLQRRIPFIEQTMLKGGDFPWIFSPRHELWFITMLGMLRVQAKHDLLLRRGLSCDVGNNYISKEVAISQIGRQIQSKDG